MFLWVTVRPGFIEQAAYRSLFLTERRTFKYTQCERNGLESKSFCSGSVSDWQLLFLLANQIASQNSSIIHEVETKEIVIVKEVWKPRKDFDYFILHVIWL